MNNPNALISSDYGPIIVNINDTIIGKHISQTGFWAKSDIELIKDLLNYLLQKKNLIVFYDVGANIGTHSLAFGKIYGEKIKIRAFEAQRQIFNMLCGTVALNGLSNIYCHNLAVSNESNNLIRMSLPNYSESNNFGGFELIAAKRSDNQDMIKNISESVETVTLDSFNENVDFIKMDIEGMEDKALMGAKSIFNNSRPICFVEIFKTDVDFLINFFKERGYLGFQKGADLIAIPSEYQIQINELSRIF